MSLTLDIYVVSFKNSGEKMMATYAQATAAKNACEAQQLSTMSIKTAVDALYTAVLAAGQFARLCKDDLSVHTVPTPASAGEISSAVAIMNTGDAYLSSAVSERNVAKYAIDQASANMNSASWSYFMGKYASVNGVLSNPMSSVLFQNACASYALAQQQFASASPHLVLEDTNLDLAKTQYDSVTSTVGRPAPAAHPELINATGLHSTHSWTGASPCKVPQ